MIATALFVFMWLVFAVSCVAGIFKTLASRDNDLAFGFFMLLLIQLAFTAVVLKI